MKSQRLKGLIRGWRNEINKLKKTRIKLKLSNLEIDATIETLNRCINDIEILILQEV